MNDRILELADQANVSQLCRVNGDWGSRLSPELQLFAQLIIQECATVCKDIAEKQFSPLYNRESDGAMICYRMGSAIGDHPSKENTKHV